MAAVESMGEVEETHTKGEGDVVLNGEVTTEDAAESPKPEKGSDQNEEPMEVDESVEAKDANKEDIDEDNNLKEDSEAAVENDAGSDNDKDVSDKDGDDQLSVEQQQQEEQEQEDEAVDKDVEMDVDSEIKAVSVNDDGAVSESEHDVIDDSNKDEVSSEKTVSESIGAEASQDVANEEAVKEKVDEGEDVEDGDDKDDVVEHVEEKEVIEIHDIDDDDDDIEEVTDNDKTKENGLPGKDSIKPTETIDLNDSGDTDGEGDVMIVETTTTPTPKENGSSADKRKAPTEVIDLESTPVKKKKVDVQSITPRRSSRNINKQKSYVESDKEEEEERERQREPEPSEESDIEEVLPEDPLAVMDTVNSVERINRPILKPTHNSSTIVVKDTKKLVEIASKTNSSTGSSGKKEPTLVIIDTNAILSGRGPVPIVTKPPAKSTPKSAAKPAQNKVHPVTSVNIPGQTNYPTLLPMALPAQVVPAKPAQPPPPPLLPTLTDDMFVVEAPSFIVPYVYEKPPKKEFKEFVKDVRKEIEEQRKKEEELEKEKERKEKEKDKESTEGDEKGDKEKEKDDKETADKKDTEQSKDDDDSNDADSEGKSDEPSKTEPDKPSEKKQHTYFDSPLGKFFIDIGVNLVQEFVQTDLLKQQKRKREREGGQNSETNKTIQSLMKNLEYTKENNSAFKMTLKKCDFCHFKTESALVLAHHLETPHMKNYVYKCNFCTYEVRSPHDILFHMEAEHAVRGRLERAPSFHQCSNCPFEDNQKGKLSRHLVACTRKFKPDKNLEPPIDWEPPAKIPRVPKMRQQGLNATAAAYQALSKNSQYQFLSKMQLQQSNSALNRGRGRPSLGMLPVKQPPALRPATGMVYKQTMSGGSLFVPTNYQLGGNQVFQQQSPQQQQQSPQTAQNQKKSTHQPSISITPLPRGSASASSSSSSSNQATSKPGDTSGKNSFVICEICDGYIKDLEQLRNHMQWIHKIKIHPKMIYNRPPLNCQKCQFRFFTDQGLERHLLGSHGLVTSSMQDAANKSKDAGRCPVCGRVYQWKLLNHVARDHNMTLKPAHLSYKCTVCTATFGMYKQFENHVYSAHSVVAKRVMDKKGSSSSSSNSKSSDVMKPLKINDEITIIPQPNKSSNGAGSSKDNSPATSSKSR